MIIIAASLIALLGNASAFTAPTTLKTRTSSISSLQMADIPADNESPIMPESNPEPPLPEMSQSLPFMKRPEALTGELAGDVGFDPLGFAKSKEELYNYREAEIKHARLAMLAAAGWPLSELWDAKIAHVLGMSPLVDASERVPSVLNGGLGKVSPIYWAVCLAAAAAIDLKGMSNKGKESYIPGDFGFDPLGLYPRNAEDQRWMQLAELKNGRLAMIAITAFAAQEFVTKLGVIDQTPIFFKPLSMALHEYANTGYISH